MKINQLKFFGILLTVAIAAILAAPISAEDTVIQRPTDYQLLRLRGNCAVIKRQLGRIRSDDALKRVNLGQNYELMSNNLMTNLNVRIAANKLNGAKLVEVSAEFEKYLETFKSNYQLYEKDLVKLTTIDCSQNAREFYSHLERVRSGRRILNYDTIKLREILDRYRQELVDFKEMIN